MNMEEKIYNLFIGRKNFMVENKTLDLLVPFILNDDFLTKFEEASNVEASNVEASNVEASNVEASNVEASNVEASNTKLVEETKPEIEAIPNTKLVEETIQKPREYRFYPKSKDCIFTCIYVAIHGEQTLYQPGVNITNMIMNEKKAISDYCNSSASILKASNFKLTIAKMNEIRCELMTQPFMNKIGGGLVACSVYYKRPIYVVFEEIDAYLRFVSKEYVEDDEDIGKEDIILRVDRGRICLDYSAKADTYREKYMELVHYEKPMASISNYKLDELLGIYKKLFLSVPVKISKTECYERVLIKMSECVSAKLY
jgi:hypothetical protein